MGRLARRWLPPLAWMGLIFFFSAQSSLPSTSKWWDLLLKKTMHALAYGVLALLYLRALRRAGRDETAMRVASGILALMYGISDEYHQTFVPGRNGSWIDVAIDGVGIVAAMLLDQRLASSARSGDSEASG